MVIQWDVCPPVSGSEGVWSPIRRMSFHSMLRKKKKTADACILHECGIKPGLS